MLLFDNYTNCIINKETLSHDKVGDPNPNSVDMRSRLQLVTDCLVTSSAVNKGFESPVSFL